MMTSRLRHIIFDLDGTLLDGLPGIEWSLRQAVAQVLGPSYPLADARTLVGPPLDKMVAAACPQESDETRRRVAAAYRAFYDTEGWRRSSLYPDVNEVLTTLKSCGLELRLLTNKRLNATLQIIDHFALGACFASIFAPGHPDHVFSTKADALGWLLEKARAPAHLACMVGDSIDDMTAAKQNGTLFIGATYGYGGITATPADPSRIYIAEFRELLAVMHPRRGKQR
jgi:phosphoglycolate phosphatase